jgi:hypothetical protein
MEAEITFEDGEAKATTIDAAFCEVRACTGFGIEALFIQTEELALDAIACARYQSPSGTAIANSRSFTRWNESRAVQQSQNEDESNCISIFRQN